MGSALPETSPKVNDRVKTRRKWFPLTGKNQILREILGGEKKRGREGGGREGEKRERGEEKQEGKVGGDRNQSTIRSALPLEEGTTYVLIGRRRDHVHCGLTCGFGQNCQRPI